MPTEYATSGSDEAIEALMRGVTSGVLYAFAVDWSPDWLRSGQVHYWTEDGQFFAICGIRPVESPPSSGEQAAVAWARKHEASH